MSESLEQNKSFQSSTSTFETAASLNTSLCTNISLTSTTDFMVPNKLHADIVQLRVEYLSVVNSMNIHLETKSSSDNLADIELLTSEQLAKACKKANKAEIVQHFTRLLNSTRPICIPNYKPDTRPKLSHRDIQVSELLTKVDTMASTFNTVNFQSLQNDLATLSQSVQSFKEGIPDLASSRPQAQIPPTAPHHEPIPTRSDVPLISKHNQCHVAQSIPDFAGSDLCDALLAAASSFTYKKENGRETVAFGESYSYNGSRNEPKTPPACVSKIMDMLNDRFKGETEPLNSCLVNRYTGPSSYLPAHSDDERCIHPTSNIYTISVGHNSLVKFTDTSSGTECQHTASHGSLYSMSRASQQFYKHRIDRNEALVDTDVRVSFTFRSVHWRNHNSTVILGDSNTGGLKFGTSGRSFRASMPGRREKAFTIDELDPMRCLVIRTL